MSNADIYQNISKYVKCGLKIDGITATGVPPHVVQMTLLKDVCSRLDALVDTADKNVVRTIDGIMQQLEDKAVGLGTVTQVGLSNALTKCLENAGLMKLVANIENNDANIISKSKNDSIPNGKIVKLISVPDSLRIPTDTTCLHACVNWFIGNEALNLPPLKFINPADVKCVNTRKRLSDLKYLMTKIQSEALKHGLVISNNIQVPTLIDIYNRCKNSIQISGRTQKGRKRRTGQLSWITVAHLLRIEEKVAFNKESES